ncbi:hypothetical protein FA15DRAFT_555079, partial [Coprinopsis marcescibilis]
GTRIAVYGLISPQGVGSTPVSRYSVDSGAVTTFRATETSERQSQALFYDSGILPADTHTLFVTNEAEGSFFWLDYLLVTPTP